MLDFREDIIKAKPVSFLISDVASRTLNSILLSNDLLDRKNDQQCKLMHLRQLSELHMR